MSNKKQSANKGSNRNTIIGVVAAVLLVVSVIIFFVNKKGSDNTAGIGDIVITKSEITQTVKFYPIKVGKINMEVMAVKASDGTIRTAFNTCQVCNGSPRAYYKQEGDMVVCQNCGNKFSMDMIEVQRGGCNPIPIMSDDKTDSGDIITISGEFIKQNKGLFTENWKSR
ncbi:MAG: DUF2318 domain-containing protein [Clostridiaceae bacterium]|nr:DUF2318 domain-containing protein [Clostridiaceae bacterium]